MKKIITSFLIFSAVCAFNFAAPKKEKSNNIKLDPKKKFAIELYLHLKKTVSVMLSLMVLADGMEI